MSRIAASIRPTNFQREFWNAPHTRALSQLAERSQAWTGFCDTFHANRVPRCRLAIATGLVMFCFAVYLVLQRVDRGLLVSMPLCPQSLSLPSFSTAPLESTRPYKYCLVVRSVDATGNTLLPRQFVLPLFLYFLVALGFALVSAALRRAVEEVAAAERSKDLLLRELGHRTKNSLSMVISILSMQAKSNGNPEVRRVLENAITRVHAIASAHEHFRLFEQRDVSRCAHISSSCALISPRHYVMCDRSP